MRPDRGARRQYFWAGVAACGGYSRLSRAMPYGERSSFKASNNKWSNNNEQ
jgi:hypothetical protein